MSDTIKKCGYVAIVGRPNVGKSTLLNAFVGYRVAAIANKPQTTRGQIQGIVTNDQRQIVFIDTPGMHQNEKSLLNKSMNAAAVGALNHVNLIAFVVEAGVWRSADDLALKRIKNHNVPVLLVINKIDQLHDKQADLLGFIDKLRVMHTFAEYVPVSAFKGENLQRLDSVITGYLPDSEFIYPEDQITDKSLRFLASELIREQIMRLLEQEVPYSTAVEIEKFEETGKLVSIAAVIWIERKGQKAIIIGKQGQTLKRIGTEARKSIEGLLEKKVYLRLWVKIAENWQNDAKRLKYLGIDQ